MPALTITAVDNSTDQLTIAAHGLLTGDCPVAIYTPDGTLPAPLAAVTDYWVIRVDANTIKLASSSSNAMAGTAINLTTNGSGTLQLQVGMPYRRARTYANGSQLPSADMNAIQDALVAIYDLLTAQAQSVFNGVALAGGLTLAANQHVTVSGSGKYKRGARTRVLHAAAAERAGGGASGNLQDDGWHFGSAGEILRFAIPVEEGERITAIGVIITDAGTDTLRMLAYKNVITVGTGVVATQLGTTQNTAGSTGVPEVLQVTGLTEDVPAGGLTNYFVNVECLTLSSGLTCHGLFVTTTIP